MAVPESSARLPPLPLRPGQREAAPSQRPAAPRRQLAGGNEAAGFSFDWLEWTAAAPLKWGNRFQPESVQLCLNLQGSGWVAAAGSRMELAPETVGFFVTTGLPMAAERSPGQPHRFLSLEFRIPFLRERLGAHSPCLHPAVRRCLERTQPYAAVSGASPLTPRHRELLRSLLHPPVPAAAQRLWYEIKALECATEFFFSAGSAVAPCTRAQRLATERVSRAKALLLQHLAEPPSLEELGRQVACSHYYLSRTFTRETGLTISQWLRRARLERAAGLLRSGQCNVTEAALEVGYSSLSHFSQAFHERYGCCPGLYPLRTCTQQQGSPEYGAVV